MVRKLQLGNQRTAPLKSINGGLRPLATRVKTARGRKVSSTKWLRRQLNDPYVKLAKAEGYRCRAAFKILEIQAKFHLFHPGKKVLDLGCAPGGWSQVVIQWVGSGNIIGVDLLPTEPIPGAEFLQGDFTDPVIIEQLHHKLGESGQCDIIMSDMAANTCGDKATDHLRIIALLEQVLAFAQAVLTPGGSLICKFFKGGNEKSLFTQLQQNFATVKFFKPQASRPESSESYLVAMGFRKPASAKPQ